MDKKLYLKTYGCQMNVYDSMRMADVLAPLGYRAVDAPAGADLVILNTCHIREKAAEKVYSELGRLRRLKDDGARQGRRMLIAVAGCVAQAEGEEILDRAPYVDIVFGPQTYHRLADMVARVERDAGTRVLDTAFPAEDKFDFLPEETAPQGVTAFLTIQEGCDKFCTFCVVPYTRGEEVSRPLADVIHDVQQLAAQGVKEITLLGQNVNAYCGTGEDGEAVDFAFLLKAIAALEGIARLRFTTSHPRDMSQRLIDVYATTPKLVSHLHLPVQSGSDRILAAMKRGHTVLEYKSIIRRVRAARPDICITSDFIVGFPGETEQDFEATMRLIDEVGFDNSFSYLYSPRPGTPAAELRDDTPFEVKAQRLKRLQDRIAEQEAGVANAMLGTTQRALVEGVSKKDGRELAARTDNNRVVNFSGAASLIGSFVELKITRVVRHTLRGEIAPDAA